MKRKKIDPEDFYDSFGYTRQKLPSGPPHGTGMLSAGQFARRAGRLLRGPEHTPNHEWMRQWHEQKRIGRITGTPTATLAEKSAKRRQSFH